MWNSTICHGPWVCFLCHGHWSTLRISYLQLRVVSRSKKMMKCLKCLNERLIFCWYRCNNIKRNSSVVCFAIWVFWFLKTNQTTNETLYIIVLSYLILSYDIYFIIYHHQWIWIQYLFVYLLTKPQATQAQSKKVLHDSGASFSSSSDITSTESAWAVHWQSIFMDLST